MAKYKSKTAFHPEFRDLHSRLIQLEHSLDLGNIGLAWHSRVASLEFPLVYGGCVRSEDSIGNLNPMFGHIFIDKQACRENVFLEGTSPEDMKLEKSNLYYNVLY
jgi:hypothetical protein